MFQIFGHLAFVMACHSNTTLPQPYLLGYDKIKELCYKHICFGILWQLNHAPNIPWHVVDGIILMKTAHIIFEVYSNACMDPEGGTGGYDSPPPP